VEHLAGLVDKSMVQAAETEGERRYRLLETIRQYAQGKMEQSPEARAFRGRHRDWYLELAERAEPELRSHDQIAWMNRLELEMDNFRAALGWSFETRENAAALRMAAALWRFWYVRGYFDEGRRLLKQALESAGSASAIVRLEAMYGAGWMEYAAQDYERMGQFGAESLKLAQEAHDRNGEAFALILLAIDVFNRGDNSLARSRLEESRSIFDELGEQWGVVQAVRLLGHIVKRQGHYELSLKLLEEALELARKLGDKSSIAMLLFSLASTGIYSGKSESAESYGKQSVAASKETGDRFCESEALVYTAVACRRQAKHSEARDLFEQSLVILRDLGVKGRIWQCFQGLAAVAHASGQSKRAARLFGAAEAQKEHITYYVPEYARREYNQVEADVSAELGEKRFQAAWAEGHALPLEQAIDYALDSTSITKPRH
jgi:tetratricopeptide (TPR) repeat protein